MENGINPSTNTLTQSEIPIKEETNNMECNICCSPFNKSTKSKITCPKCDFSSCKICFKKWILEVVSNPRCMNCKREYSYEHLTKTLPLTWLNGEFREKKAEIIIERERSLLPQSQKELDEIRNREINQLYRNLIDTRINSCRFEGYALTRLLKKKFLIRFDEFYSNEEMDILKAKIHSLNSERNEIQNKLKGLSKRSKEYISLTNRLGEINSKLAVNNSEMTLLKDERFPQLIRSLGNHYDDQSVLDFKGEIEAYNELTQRRELLEEKMQTLPSIISTENNKEEKGFKFIVHCPKDDCRGFLSTRYKCGICGVRVCSKCREIMVKKEEHECNEDNIKNVETIKSETKSCPSCGVPIYKISGCNDMWCWSCHIPFNYRTGKIDESNSNPHYWEWVRTHRVRDGVELDICGRDISNIQNKEIIFDGNPIPVKVSRIFGLLIHARHNTMRQYPDQNPATICSNLRIKYLSYELSESEWTRRTFLAHRKNDYNLEMRQILHVLVEAGSSIISRMVDSGLNTKAEKKKFAVELGEIKKYVNEIMKSIAKRYNVSRRPYINKFWSMGH